MDKVEGWLEPEQMTPQKALIATVCVAIALSASGCAWFGGPPSAAPVPAAAEVMVPDSPAGSLPADALVLDTGDVVKVTVFQSPDMQTEARVDESGSITLPLIGAVAVRSATPRQAEQRIATALEKGKFLRQPQVTVTVLQFRSQQVSVLGNVNRPGRYPLDLRYTLSDMLAVAGGITINGADFVTLSRRENGRVVNRDIDLENMFDTKGSRAADLVLQAGDVIYVKRAPMYYVHGEVQRPGTYRVERFMTIRQAVATAGGVTARGTLRGIRVERRGADGKVTEIHPESLDDPVQANDVISIRESLF